MCACVFPGISIRPQRQTAALLPNLLIFFLAMKIFAGDISETSVTKQMSHTLVKLMPEKNHFLFDYK